MALEVIILAAGQGKRMFSSQPKVLNTLAGRPMLRHVIDTAKTLNPAKIHIVVGFQHEKIREAFKEEALHWAFQAEQLGTAHAVMQALPNIAEKSEVLVLYGDVPLIDPQLLEALYGKIKQTQHLGLIVAHLNNPHGLGRVVRNSHGNVVSIVEERDATAEERKIEEIYTGICCTSRENLVRWLSQVSNQNAQNEYYLTDIVMMAAQAGCEIVSVKAMDEVAVQGVNDPLQLQKLERIWQQRTAEHLLLSGVRIADVARFDLRGTLTCESDVFIDVNVIFIGRVVLEQGVNIGPNCVLKNVTVGKNSIIKANSMLEDCEIAQYCEVGPFSRLRPGTVLADQCRVGNFVETKNTRFGVGTKANHLSYIGDAKVGEAVNIGAGTITCNYDGANKHETIIEDGAFIGSDTQLVAPIRVGRNATIGAGTTLRRSAISDALTLTESHQKTVAGWKRPEKKE